MSRNTKTISIIFIAIILSVFTGWIAEDNQAYAARRGKKVTSVSVEAETTSSLSTYPGTNASGTTGTTGMAFEGKVTFGKVTMNGRAKRKLKKRISSKARRTCASLFSGGPVDGLTPKIRIWTYVGPLPAQPFISTSQSLATNDFSDTEISGAGSKSVLWNEQSKRAASFIKNDSTWYGITPGYEIRIQGGWWDPERSFIRDHSSSFNMKQAKRRTEISVSCSRFEASTVWND